MQRPVSPNPVIVDVSIGATTIQIIMTASSAFKAH
jgi:hypothetical protein